MKTIKSFDFFSQVILITISVVALLIGNSDQFNPLHFIIAFGVIQIISIIVHLAAGKQDWKKTGWRKIHHLATVLVLIVILLIFLLDASGPDINGLGILFYATVVAVLLALSYFLITGIEWMNLKKML